VKTNGGGRTLAGIFGMTDFMIPMVLDDLTDEQAFARPRGEGGPSIAWTVGHLLHYRVFMLNRFGQSRDNPFEAKFGNVAATDGSDYPSLAELRRTWDEVEDEFVAAVSALSEAELDAQLQEGWHAEQTLRDQVVFFAWHEGYHLGALGQIRKALGLPGPAERVMAVRQAEGEAGAG
jgi:uncharacterized damage-inducible protein DinB